MKNILIAGAVAACLAFPATAATIDFTANNATSGNVLDTTWTATGSNAPTPLRNAIHWNNAGCQSHDWKFACAATGTLAEPYDVGFGIKGNGNNEEIDGSGSVTTIIEFVKVVFGKRVNVTGFAGMLTYANRALDGAREQVVLDYLKSDGTWGSVIANPKAAIGNSFDTVGLAYRDDLNLYTTAVRFRATGVGTADDGSFNVTAAGLQVAPVPVPAGLPLLLTGVGALAWAARRKQRKAA